ncbi:MAG: sugar ABC transporter permease [Firmicutes bacterium]|nr:sugar ABC transporter permease [Bacillota bacterium]
MRGYTRARILEIVILVAPSLLFILGTVIFPTFYVAHTSLFDWFYGKRGAFIGLTNYWRLLNDPEFHQVFKNTLVYSLGGTFLGLFMGLLFALFLDGVGQRTRNLMRVIVLVPYMISWVAAGVTFKWMFNTETGVFNYLFLKFGLIGRPLNWLGEPRLAMLSCIVTMAWATVPFITLILLAGLQNIPRELYEAAAIDGANGFKKFRYVTMPLLRTPIFVCLLIRTIYSLRDFDIPFTITRGGPGLSTKVFAILLREKLTNLDFGYNAALSMALLVLVLGITALYTSLLGGDNT